MESQIRGALLGLLVGDALGVPYEFKAPSQIPEVDAIDLEPPPGYRRSHSAVPAGTWSDDGAQALCLLESLLERGRMDADDFAGRMVAWYTRGHLAVDGRVFDVGIQTSAALRAIQAGVAPLSAAATGENANGNGALMRVLPLALWHRGSDVELVRDACVSSRPTHAHLRSQLCCALYCLWIRRLLASAPEPWEEAAATLRRILARDSAALEEIEKHIRPAAHPNRPGSGYVVDTLRSARMLAAQPDYEHAVKAAVQLGEDTDTTAAVIGGAIGARDGVESIPTRWRTALRGQELVEPLLRRLLAR